MIQAIHEFGYDNMILITRKASDFHGYRMCNIPRWIRPKEENEAISDISRKICWNIAFIHAPSHKKYLFIFTLTTI